ncbi:putative nuclease HARBI1 [Senna tora]|uniref:Putative nuclease HARBI1 n=1 Tax=Senna tora TaxID=362788 RepID=A0A834T1H1_9FABA|nr:putative nuclease HARBI1 [Senna tora]
MFLGVAHGHKGFKVYNLEAKTISVSRDVRFYEDVFPYGKVAGQDNEKDNFKTIPNVDFSADDTSFDFTGHPQISPGPSKQCERCDSDPLISQDASDLVSFDSPSVDDNPITDGGRQNSPSKGLDDFEFVFRISKKTFEYICSLVKDDI